MFICYSICKRPYDKYFLYIILFVFSKIQCIGTTISVYSKQTEALRGKVSYLRLHSW